MSFSRGQQPAFRKLVALAWQAYCRAKGIVPAPAKHSREWYEAALYEATGHTSTTDCNAGRDYDLVMAHFEAESGDGIRWQMKAHSGDAKRIAHNIREICADHDIDEDYMRRVACRALRLDRLPELLTLKREQLILIMGELKRFVRRRLTREAAAAALPELPPYHPAPIIFLDRLDPEEGDPF